MNNRNKYLFKNLGILTISNFASKIMVFLLVPLYTSVLTTSEYGIYDIVISTISLLYPILTLNIVDAVMRFCMDKAYSNEEIATIGIKYVSISIVIVGLVLSISHFLNVFSSINGLKKYIFLYYLSYVLNQYFIQFAKGLEKVKEMGIAGVCSTFIMIVTNILFLLVFDYGLDGFLIANIMAQVAPVIYLFVKLKYWIYLKKIKINKAIEREMMKYCLPLIFTVIAWWINSTADKYVVTYFCGIAVNGLFSVSYKIPSIINTLQSIFIQAWQISAIKEYGQKDVSIFYGRAFTYINLLMSISCAGMIVLSKTFAHILYAKDFYMAWEFVPFLLVSSVLNCASGILGPILSAKKDSKSMATSAVYGAIANVFMNFVLVYVIGVQGATIATVISSFVIYFFRKKAVGSDININGYWKILLTWGLLCTQAIVEIYTNLWYIEIGIIILLLVINMSVLKAVINKICIKHIK